MKRILHLVILTIAFVFPIYSQTQSCVKIESENGANVFRMGDPARLRAIVNKELSTIGAKYVWKLSAGKIVSGENTDSILLDLKVNGSETITATVKVEGISGLCSKSASFTFEVEGFVCQLPLDYFSNNLTLSAAKARLDNVAVTLLNNPGYIAYVTSIYDKNETFEKAQNRLKKWKSYLIKTGVLTDNVVFVLLSENQQTGGRTIIQVADRSVKILPTEGNYIIID